MIRFVWNLWFIALSREGCGAIGHQYRAWNRLPNQAESFVYEGVNRQRLHLGGHLGAGA